MLKIRSRFGPRTHPITGELHNHSGIDLAYPEGTPVYASIGGRVEKVDVLHPKNGNAVFIAGVDGRRWAYLHLAQALVAPGQTVARDQQLGTVGSTGSATGPHLHLQVSVGGVAVDPELLFPPGTFEA